MSPQNHNVSHKCEICITLWIIQLLLLDPFIYDWLKQHNFSYIKLVIWTEFICKKLCYIEWFVKATHRSVREYAYKINMAFAGLFSVWVFSCCGQSIISEVSCHIACRIKRALWIPHKKNSTLNFRYLVFNSIICIHFDFVNQQFIALVQIRLINYLLYFCIQTSITNNTWLNFKRLKNYRCFKHEYYLQ